MTAGPLADWQLAERLGWLVGSTGLPRVTRDDARALRTDLRATLARADEVARTVTGLGRDLPPAELRLVGRRAWIRGNVESLAHLTEPVADRLVRTSGLARGVARRGIAVQLGIVFGYLSTKVLGQYEVLLPGGREPGRLTLVGPNLVELERTMLDEVGCSAGELRMGICLHEVAHRLQFEGVPWLRPALREIVDTYLAEARIDPERVREAAAAMRELFADPRRLREPQAFLEAVLTPVQRSLLERAQALMSLLEGHGNVVMDWGAEVVAAEDGLDIDPARVRTALNRRRQGAPDKVMRRALGLALKAEQYRVGERFILRVAERHGRAAFDEVWNDPGNVPTSAEFEDPETWVARVSASTR